MGHQVFISYASEDVADADRICAKLESAEISCWMAPRDIKAGANYPAAIVDALASCTVMVLLLTEHAVASRHVLSEVGHAFNNRKRIVPFRLPSVSLSKDLDYFLAMAQWLDAPDGCTDESLARLTEATRSAIRGDAPMLGATEEPQGPQVRRLALIAFGVLAAAAVAYWVWPRHTQPIAKPPITQTDPKPIPDIAHGVPPPPTVKTWLNATDGQEYVWIPPGTFTMGCSPADSECTDDEKPSHPVEIEKGFWLARTEATIAAYRKFAARHGVKAPPGEENLPITGLTRAEAKAYCADAGGRLPTEAEWEYAARGGKAEAYYGVVGKIAWYAENSGGNVHAVGGKAPNIYGLYDMLGNVSEWVLDRYYNKYDLTSPATGPDVEQPVAPNSFGATRGGFWDGNTATIRASHRASYMRDETDVIVGVRCANDHS